MFGITDDFNPKIPNSETQNSTPKSSQPMVQRKKLSQNQNTDKSILRGIFFEAVKPQTSSILHVGLQHAHRLKITKLEAQKLNPLKNIAHCTYFV